MIHLKLDPTGFPMILVEKLGAYVHLLPVTKIQYEYYLWSTSQSGGAQTEYQERCEREKSREWQRITPSSVNSSNYWHIFIGGLDSGRAMKFAQWSTNSDDGSYCLPEDQEWQAVRDFFRERNLDPEEVFKAALALDRLSPRCDTILRRLQEVMNAPYRRNPGLEERLFFHGGVMEWVSLGQGKWGLRGLPDQDFARLGYDPESQKPHVPTEGRPPHWSYGFRLFRKA